MSSSIRYIDKCMGKFTQHAEKFRTKYPYATQKIQACWTGAGEHLFRYSIFHAFARERLMNERLRYQNYTRWQNIKLGLRESITFLPKYYLLATAAEKANRSLYGESPPSKYLPRKSESLRRQLKKLANMVLVNVIFTPCSEEFVHRFCIQNILQFMTIRPEFSIVGSAYCFAILHKHPESVATMMLMPILSILYYTTRSLPCVIATHVMLNLSILVLVSLASPIDDLS